MYHPSEKSQKGGDLTDTLPDGTTVTISQSTMSLIAEMANVSSFAQMSSFVNFNSLTPVEVSQLLNALGQAISNENRVISENTASIIAINDLINRPITGLQAVYNSTIDSYSTTVLNYHGAITSLCTTMSLISTYHASISSLLILDEYQLSEVSSLRSKYSTIMKDVNHKLDTLKSQKDTYTSLSTNYKTYATNYSTFYLEYSAGLGALGTDTISLNNAYNTYIQSLNSNDLTTVSTLSSIYMSDLSTTYVLSSILGDNLYNQSSLRSYVQSTLNSINSLAVVSTIYGSPELDDYYSTIRVNTLSTIESHRVRKRQLRSTIRVYHESHAIAENDSHAEYRILNQQITTFYAKALKNAQNILLSYKYQIQEWSAFVGYIVTQLLIQKSYIALEINGVSVNSNTENVKSLSDLSVLQTKLQTIVGSLNVLDLSFNEILGICSNEMTERGNYITARQNSTALEGSVLLGMSTYTDVYQTYSTHESQATQSAININAYQSQRLAAMAAIMKIINPQLGNINKLIQAGSIAITFTLPEDVSTDNTPFATDPTVYQILAKLGSSEPTTTEISRTTT
jgi:hypothetical protein